MKDNWTLRVYDFDGRTYVYKDSFFAATDVTADKIARNTVERDWPGHEWSLMPLDSDDES